MLAGISHGIRGRGQALRFAADKDLLELAGPPKGPVPSALAQGGAEPIRPGAI